MWIESGMHLHELDFDFPQELIAQEPAEPRDSCRLMFLPQGGGIEHHRFWELPALLRPGDTVGFNDSRVLPARVWAQKLTGGLVELRCLHPPADVSPARVSHDDSGADGEAGEMWEALARPSHRLRPGSVLILPGGEELILHELMGEGRWLIRGPAGTSLLRLMEVYGKMPLPPYIKSHSADAES